MFKNNDTQFFHQIFYVMSKEKLTNIISIKTWALQ